MNLSSPVRVLLVSDTGSHRDEILQGLSDLQSSLTYNLLLELIHYFFDPPDVALLPISDLLDRIRGGFFQLVCVLPPNATWKRQLRSRVPRPHSLFYMPMRVASARPGLQNKQPSAISAA